MYPARCIDLDIGWCKTGTKPDLNNPIVSEKAWCHITRGITRGCNHYVPAGSVKSSALGSLTVEHCFAELGQAAIGILDTDEGD